MRRLRAAHEVDILIRVDVNPLPFILLVPADVTGIDQLRAIGADLGDKRILSPVVTRIQRAADGKVGGSGPSGYVGIAGGVDRNVFPVVKVRSTDVTGVDQPRRMSDSSWKVATLQSEPLGSE